MTTMATATRPVDRADDGSCQGLRRAVVGGIDTHKDLHVAAVIDSTENVLGTRSFSTTRAGYRAVVRWMHGFGTVTKVGIRGHWQLRCRHHAGRCCVCRLFRPPRSYATRCAT